MLIAYMGGAPAGFVSGIEMPHPDKGTEMCLYELSVDERYRRRAGGRAPPSGHRDRTVGRG